ncbi:MAG: CHAT domain-containing protein [Acidobacteria bacterium]|nr:CHAT domain-containing protein [Acidobacteriota bacterium]
MGTLFRNLVAIGLLCSLFLVPVGVLATQEQSQPALVKNSIQETPQKLEINQPIEREIKGTEIQVFRVNLLKDQFLRFEVDQKLGNVLVKVLDPSGKMLHETNGLSTGETNLIEHLVADLNGDYRIEIKPVRKNAILSKYIIRLVEIREATSQDKYLFTTICMVEDARKLGQQQTKEALKQALEVYKEVHLRWKIIGDKTEEASALSQMGNIYYQFGEMEKALECFLRVLSLVKDVKNRFGEAVILNSIGSIYRFRGEFQVALGYFHQSLSIRRDLGDQKGTARVLSSIAHTYSLLADNRKALECYQQALRISQELQDSNEVMQLLTSISTVQLELGNYQNAYQLLQQALHLNQTIANRLQEVNILHNIGGVFGSIGDNDTAIKYDRKALKAASAIGYMLGQTEALCSIGVSYYNLGNYQEGLGYLEQALQLQRLSGDKGGEAYTLQIIGEFYSLLDNYQKASEYLEAALSLNQSINRLKGEIVVLKGLGRNYSFLKQYDKAIELFKLALEKSRIAGDRNSEISILHWWAWAEGKRGDLSSARSKVEAAIELIESNRSNVVRPEFRETLASRDHGTYLLYLDVLMQLLHVANPKAGFDAEALYVNERSRARSLMELLQEAKTDIRQGIDPKLLEREQELLQRITAKEQLKIKLLLGGKYSSEQMETVTSDLDALLEEHRKIQDEIRQTSPHYANLTQPQPLTVKEIQNQVLDKDTLLLEYALGDQQSYLWVVSSTGLKSFPLASSEKIGAATQRLCHILGEYQIKENEPRLTYHQRAAQLDIRYSAVSSELSELILKPAADLLGKKRLLIVADGALQYIPFAALPSPNSSKQEPLITFHEITHLPSASTLAVLRKELAGRPKSPKTLAIVADPVFDLHDPRLAKTTRAGEKTATAKADELKSIAFQDRALRAAQASGVLMGNTSERLIGTRRIVIESKKLIPQARMNAWMDFEAVRARAINPALAKYQIVHFGTHGHLDTVSPGLSGLFFTRYDQTGQELPEYFLSAIDAYNLKLPAELVVLQACETGVSAFLDEKSEPSDAKASDSSSKKLTRLKNINPEGLNFLTCGFMYAGARRVMVSLWKIGDQSSSEVLIRMYRRMFGSKRMSPSAALRAAQLEMLNHPKWSRPYFWSGMVIHGEW